MPVRPANTKYRRSGGSGGSRVLTGWLAGAGLIAACVAGAGTATAAAASSPGDLSLVAGTGTPGQPTPGPATSSELSSPGRVAVDSAGNVYIADINNHVVEKVTPGGTLSIVAGNGTTSGSPRPGPATGTSIGFPYGVAVDSAGNLFISDLYGYVLKVTPGGTLSIIAGTGANGPATPGPATSSDLDWPQGVAVDSAGNVYIADTDNNEIEEVTPGGVLSIIAGTGAYAAPTPGPATTSALKNPFGVAVDSAGNVYIADTNNSRIEKVTPAGILSVIAGTGNEGSPTPGPATSSNMGFPDGVAVDPDGNVYIADGVNNEVEEVTPSGTLSVIAGTGTQGSPTAGPATSSELNFPYGVAVDSGGDVFIADYGNNEVEEVGGNEAPPGPPTFLFVNENPNGPNEVANYVVNADGTTSLVGTYATGHPGSDASWLAAGRADLARSAGYLYALNLGDQTVTVFSVNATSGALTLVATTAPLGATTIAVNPTGTVLYAGGSQNAGSLNQLSAYAINPDGTIGSTPVSTVSADVDGLAVSPDGTEVAAAYPGTSPAGASVQLFSSDATGHLTAQSVLPEACPTDVAFAGSASTLVSASCYSGSVQSYDVPATGTATVTGTMAGAGQTVAVGPDDTVYFQAPDGLRGAQISGPQAGPATFTLGPATGAPDDSIASMTVSPDGTRLFTASFASGTINDYSIGPLVGGTGANAGHTLTLLEQIPIEAGLPTVIAYNPPS